MSNQHIVQSSCSAIFQPLEHAARNGTPVSLVKAFSRNKNLDLRKLKCAFCKRLVTLNRKCDQMLE